MNELELKKKVAFGALKYIDDNPIIGVGSGTTVDCFIDALATIKHKIEACVVSSKQSEMRLKALNIPVVDLNTIGGDLPIYIDGADEVNFRHEMIKGGGGALTREKIVATVAKKFVCIVDERKLVEGLGTFPVAVEVIPMARGYVAREIIKLGGDPEYRQGFLTDNGNIILDVYNLDPVALCTTLETKLNLIPGVVENGIFTNRKADVVLVAGKDDVMVI